MKYIFKSGKYEGKSIAQVALADYSQLKDLQAFLKDKNPFLFSSIEEVVRKLNNFIPQVKCRYHEGCGKTADFLSIAISYGDIPRGDHTSYGPIGISASTGYAGCTEHIDDIMAVYHKARKYPIRFDSILSIPEWPKWVRKDVSKVLLECAGFKGRKDYDNCENFLRNLEQRV